MTSNSKIRQMPTNIENDCCCICHLYPNNIAKCMECQCVPEIAIYTHSAITSLPKNGTFATGTFATDPIDLILIKVNTLESLMIDLINIISRLPENVCNELECHYEL